MTFSPDDILVHTKTWEDHVNTIQELFSRMRRANLTARPSKCLIATDSVDFLGHQIQHGEVGLHIDNVDKIRNAPRPKTKKEVRSFIGLVGYYREYIPNFATIAAPLTDLTKNKQPNKVEWGEPQERSYNTLKGYLNPFLPDARMA